jgi:hypothetical protein
MEKFPADFWRFCDYLPTPATNVDVNDSLLRCHFQFFYDRGERMSGLQTWTPKKDDIAGMSLAYNPNL